MAKITPALLFTVFIIAALLTLTFGWFGVTPYIGNALNQGSTASVVGSGGQPAATPSQQCNPAPTITLQYADQFNGTPVTFNVTQMKINDGNPIAVVSSASGQVSGGNKVQLLLGAPAYPAIIVPTFTVGCSTNPTAGQLVSQATFPSLSVIGGNNVILTNKTAATQPGVNETNTSSALLQTLRVNPAAYQGTGNLVLVVDANSTTKVTSITSGLATYSGGVPGFYTPQSTTSRIMVYRIPASNSLINVPVTFNPASGQDLSNVSIMYTVYQTQDIIDVNGQFVPNEIQDSLHNGKFFKSGMTQDYISLT